MTYLLIFISALAAATILPLSSEVAVIAAIKTGFNPWFVWLAASLGNILGSVINWLLGGYIERFRHHRWFPFSDTQLDKAQQQFKQYGVWTLLFAWLPVIGDALTLAAGVLRIRISVFLLLVSIGKSLRYGLVILALLNFF